LPQNASFDELIPIGVGELIPIGVDELIPMDVSDLFSRPVMFFFVMFARARGMRTKKLHFVFSKK
jgi:hypothetical protein